MFTENATPTPSQSAPGALDVPKTSRAPLSVKELFSTKSSQQDQGKLRKTLERLILVRVLILSAIFGVASWGMLSGAQGVQSSNVFVAIGIIYALSAINATVLRKVSNLGRLAYCQLSLDVVFATLAIYITNSGISIFLYLLTIVAAAVVSNRKGAVTIAAFSGLAYGVLMSGLLPPFAGHRPSASSVDILVVYLSLVAIALVSAYLAQQLELLGVQADRSKRDLIHLNEQQRRVFNDMSEGIITLDLKASITGINQAALSILGLSQLDMSSFVGRPLPEVFREKGLADGDQLIRTETLDAKGTELVLKNAKTNEEIHLDYSLRTLEDDEGNASGKILIFNDVSHVKNIEERLSLHEQMTKLLAQTDEPLDARSLDLNAVHMTGESAIMKRVYALVERVAASDASVLICGESGTGKELIAKAIHSHGSRKNRPFVAINCGAIPENLIESELFGHKKGSFTGAVNDNPGLFRQASGGTIFLDEIGELPLQMQTKLLRVLQERTIRPVGDVRDYPVDVRVIAATNRDLKHEIAGGRFREDVFYRLNVVSVVVPPLRDRKEDIPLLVRNFIGRLCNPDRVLPQVSAEALQLLMAYQYPGNIRELENIVERALVLGGQAILPEHLPEELVHANRRDQKPVTNTSAGETQFVELPINLEAELEKLERHYLFAALDQTRGVKKHAAELLGLNFRSFRYRLKKYGVSDGNGDND